MSDITPTAIDLPDQRVCFPGIKSPHARSSTQSGLIRFSEFWHAKHGLKPGPQLIKEGSDMLKVAQQAPQSRRHDSWPDFCEQLGTASLTLVGFEKQDLSKVYDALDLCSKTRNIQAVEVFIRTLDELDEAQSSVAPGLCMIYMPDFQQGAPYHKALLLLSDLAEYDTVTVIPVLKPYESKRSILDAIGCACPAYLNPDSELRDFVAMFSAFLFPAQRDQKAPHRDFASVGPELTFAV